MHSQARLSMFVCIHMYLQSVGANVNGDNNLDILPDR